MSNSEKKAINILAFSSENLLSSPSPIACIGPDTQEAAYIRF